MPSKPHAIDDLGMVGGDLLEERRFHVGHEEAETLLEMAGFRALLVRGGFGAERAALHPGEPPRRLLR